LPAEGPVSEVFPHGPSDAVAEGFVVRFWNDDRTEWVGNFQAYWGEGSVFDLPGSTSLCVIAYGACCFLPKSDPDQYTCKRHGVSSALLDEQERLLILAHRGGDLVAYAPNGTKAWVRNGLAVDGIELKSCVDGIITADVEYDYDGSRRTIRIRAADGTDLQDETNGN
jgi:hypothetical protein